MAYKNRFYKSLLGVDAEVLVTLGVAYSDSTDIKSFVADAVEGELAVFNADSGAILTSAAAVGDKVFIGLKRDGNLERTTTFVIEAGMLSKIAYIAPVKQISTITTTGTPAKLENINSKGASVYAKTSGTAGNSITFAITVGATAGAEVVTVTGNAISVQVESGVSTATQMVAAVAASTAAAALVTPLVTGTGSTTQTVFSATNLAGGVDQPEIAKGDYVEVAIIETTPGLEPMPRYEYGLTANQDETFQALMVRLVAKINDSTNIENQNKTLIVTAAIDGTSGVTRDNFTLTAIDYNVHFTVALRGLLADFGSHSVTTVFKQGSGTAEQAKIAEDAGDTRKGIGTQYPVQNAVSAEFGAPTSFASANGADAHYVVYTIKFFGKDETRTLDRISRKNFIFLYIWDTTSDPISNLDTIFANAD